MALRPLAQTVPLVAEKAFNRKYILLGRIVTQWAEIVGPEFAGTATPCAIRRYRTGKEGEGGKIHVCLDIAASSADAARLIYQRDLLLERMNRIFGECLVDSIKFVHLPANSAAAPAPRYRKPLTESQKKTLSLMLEGIEDEQVKAALERLGTAVLRERNET
jgi:hypothetical protein